MIALHGLETKQQYITAEGFEELRQTLEQLKRERARLAVEARSVASQSGSNSALDESLQALNHSQAAELDAQILALKRIIATAKIIPKPATNRTVQLGSRVTVQMDGNERAYSLVGSLEVDPIRGKISNESPLGIVLLGKKLHDRFEVPVRDRRIPAVVIRID
jgi:transcription elongation factor GreA